VLGFHYQEVLHGGFYFLDDPPFERAADLVLDVAVKDVTRLRDAQRAEVRGRVTLEGFADDPDAEGKLVLDRAGKRLHYDVSFKANGGEQYRLRGHKQLEMLNLVDSLTLVRASLYNNDAREVGRATVRFDARGNWKSLVGSIRPLF
jgi:hypothetical protein